MIVRTGSVDELKMAIKSIDKKVEIDVKKWTQFMNENYGMYGVKLCHLKIDY